jgi:hypothetical protein
MKTAWVARMQLVEELGFVHEKDRDGAYGSHESWYVDAKRRMRLVLDQGNEMLVLHVFAPSPFRSTKEFVRTPVGHGTEDYELSFSNVPAQVAYAAIQAAITNWN